MIFNENKTKRYFVLEKKAIVEECRNQYRGAYESERKPMGDEVVYHAYELLRHPFLQEDGTLREATDKELLDKGIYRLADNQVLVGDTAKYIYEFPIPEGIVKPVFNKDRLEWEETATDKEIEEAGRIAYIGYINDELEATNKFDLINYRNFITAQGDNIEEMDAYRTSLLELQHSFYTATRKKKFRLNLPNKPSWADKYK